MNDFEKEVLDLLIDIRDRLEVLICDSGDHLEAFRYYAVTRCDHPYNYSVFCNKCRFKSMCKKFYNNED